ncbi:MFS transporter [Vibrio sp. H11]|uniref:MFS transporter n=1 Tax=Vibrio sp. H11 TaxID=2565928 RepID=UPI0010A63759|nr:MFS transporter [Vibrio sp. H11]
MTGTLTPSQKKLLNSKRDIQSHETIHHSNQRQKNKGTFWFQPEKQASAIAAMFLGATLANIFGAPFGTYIGQIIGWRNTYYIIAALGVISALSIAKLLPHIESEAPTNLKQEFAALIQPGKIRALLITIFGFGGTFTAFTYISPILTDITGMSLDYVPAMLLLFGAGMAVGNPIGARLTNKSVVFGMRSTLLLLMVVLVALYFAMGSTVAMVVVTFLFGVAMFATIPSLQTYVLSEAGKAPILASAFNIAAFNLGNAGGAWVGGEVIDAGLSLQILPIIAAAVTAFGLLLTLSVRTKRETPELVTA